MTYQIDQSGKIEQTERKTVLAAINSKTAILILSAKDKRRLQEIFRQIGKPRLFIDISFSVCLHLLIKQLSVSKVIVDTEYLSHTKTIEQMVNRLSNGKTIIEWKKLGKLSKAHEIANKAGKKRVQLGKKITLEAVLKEAKKLAGGRLTQEWIPGDRRSAPAIKRNIAKKGEIVKKGAKK